MSASSFFCLLSLPMICSSCSLSRFWVSSSSSSSMNSTISSRSWSWIGAKKSFCICSFYTIFKSLLLPMVDSFFRSFFLVGLGLVLSTVCLTSFLLKFFIAEPGGDPSTLVGEALLVALSAPLAKPSASEFACLRPKTLPLRDSLIALPLAEPMD